MSSPSDRLAHARLLWGRADAAHQGGDLQQAFLLATEAHDLVTDQPGPHREAHERLLPLDRALGRRRDVRTDRLLLALAPVSFRLLALWFAWTTTYPEVPAVRPGSA